MRAYNFIIGIAPLAGYASSAMADGFTLEEFGGSFTMVFFGYAGLVALCHLLFLLPKKLLKSREAEELEQKVEVATD